MALNQDLFYSFALEVSSPVDPDQLIDNVLDKLLTGMDLRTGIIYTLDNLGEQLLLKAHRGISKKICNKLSKRSLNNDQTAAEVISSNVPIVQRDISRIDKIYKTFIKPEKSCFFIYIPVVSSNGAAGLILFQGSDSREFIADDMNMFKAVGRILGQAIEHCSTNEEIRHKADELDLLQKINSVLTNYVSIDEIFQIIATGMVKVFGYTGSLVFLDGEGKGDSIILKAYNYDFDNRIIKKIEKLVHFAIKGHEFHPEKNSISSCLYFDQLPVISNNISDALIGLGNRKSYNKITPAVAHLLPVKSAILVPLVADKKVQGVLVVASKRELNQEDVNRVQAFAAQASLAVEKARLHMEETRRSAELSALQTISDSVSSSLDLKEILQNTTRQMAELFHADHSGILTYDENCEWGEVVAEYPDRGAVHERIRIKGYAAAEKIIADQQPLMIEDTMHDPLMVSAHETIVNLDIHSMLILPLVIKGKTIGSIGLDSIGKKHSSRSDEIALAQAIAGQVSIAIENARLFKALKGEKGRLEFLYDISSKFTSDPELERILQGIIDRITTELGGHIGYLFSFEPDEKMLSIQAVSGIKISASILTNEARLSPGQGLNGWVMLNKKPAVVSDVTKDKRWFHVDEIDHDVHAAISVPLFLDKKVVGVITVLHPDVNYFDNPEYLHLLTAVSNQVAAIMEKALLYKKLKDSEERFRHITANTGDWVWEVDTQGKIIYSSPVITQILGYSYQEVLGKYTQDFSPPEEREKLESNFNKMVQTKKPYTAFVNCILHKDGHKVMLESSGTPIIDRNGKVTGYRGADHDITARFQAEQALAASELKYRVLVENVNNWIWTLDPEGHLIFFNRAAEEGSGYKGAEWIGQNFAPIISPEGLSAVQLIYSEILRGKSKSYETRICTRSGNLITLAVNTVPLYEDGVITGTVSMGQDITKQKQLETQLRQAQKMEAIGTLASGVAHDFNNILSGILGYVSLMKLNITFDNPHFTELDAVISLVKRASDLTRQLLGFARGGKYQVQPVNLNNIINEVINLLSRTIDKSIRIKPVLGPNLSAVEADAGQIQQMILNLCLNASDAMPEGGELLIETKNLDINENSFGNIPDLPAGSYIFFSVSDTGIGMDGETKKRVFDPFFTTKEGIGKNKHSGLGLSMIYGIVKNHKGIIKVYSEPGEGTNFKIYLPATNLEVINTDNKPIAVTGGKETILIVDDEDAILESAAKILGNAGYKVMTVNGGRKALKLFKKQYKEIDIVILDMIMPDMNGRETYNKLKEINSEVKVLLSSGYSRNGKAQELINSGVKDFLQKPYEFEKMLIKIRQVLDSK